MFWNIEYKVTIKLKDISIAHGDIKYWAQINTFQQHYHTH